MPYKNKEERRRRQKECMRDQRARQKGCLSVNPDQPQKNEESLMMENIDHKYVKPEEKRESCLSVNPDQPPKRPWGWTCNGVFIPLEVLPPYDPPPSPKDIGGANKAEVQMKYSEIVSDLI